MNNYSRRWSSVASSHLAVVGAAVGLGSIWRFPYLAGMYGGGAFVSVFALACFLIATPLLVAEFILGRATQLTPPVAGAALAGPGRSRVWNAAGGLGSLAAFLIDSYYTIIAGWVCRYLWLCASGELTGQSRAQLDDLFHAFLLDPIQICLWQALFLALAAVISAGGPRLGIEMANRIRGPAFAVLLLVLVSYACVVGDAREGLRFSLYPDWSKLTAAGVLAAIGQAFFATGVGMAMMIAYGAYIPREASLVRAASLISGAIVGVSLLASLMIFPLVFRYGFDPAQGPELVFQVLTSLFAAMPGGRIVGTLFFLLLMLAALMPTVAALEPAVAWVERRPGMTRGRAVVGTLAALWVVGLGSVASFNVLRDWYPLGAIGRLHGMTFYGLIDFLTSNLMLPLGAILTSVLVGWVASGRIREEQLASTSPWIRHLLWGLLRYLCPVAILVVLVTGLAAP